MLRLKDTLILPGFLIAIFFLRLPLLYIGVINPFFTTEFIAVFIVVSISIYYLYRSYFLHKDVFNFSQEFFLISIFFITQSLSIVDAINPEIFISRYTKVVFGLLIFFVVKILSEKFPDLPRLLIRPLLGGFFITLFIQFILYFFPQMYALYGKFTYTTLFNITLTNIKVGKLLDDTFIEIITPILVFKYLSANKTKAKVFSISLILVTGFISFASNFRYRILTFLFGLLIALLTFGRIKNKVLSIGLALIFLVMTFFIADTIVSNQVGFSVVDRLSDSNSIRDYATITWRLKMYDESIRMANTHLFGVGLGNFYDNLSRNYVISTNLPSTDISVAALKGGPHNIFFQLLGETGYPGLISFIALLLLFFKRDIKAFFSKNDYKKMYILCFWTLLFAAQFFPAINFEFFTLFFLCRAIV